MQDPWLLITWFAVRFCRLNLQTDTLKSMSDIKSQSGYMVTPLESWISSLSFTYANHLTKQKDRQIYKIKTINFPKVGKQRFMCQLSHHIKKKYVVRLNVSQYKMGWFRTSPQRLHPAKFCWGQTFPNILILLAGVKNTNTSTGSKWTLLFNSKHFQKNKQVCFFLLS